MLRVSELHEYNSSQKKKEKDFFKTLLENCYKKIKNANIRKLSSTSYRLEWIGHPVYDMNKALKYIMYK